MKQANMRNFKQQRNVENKFNTNICNLHINCYQITIG
jgi:hypothetical protein